MGADVYEMDGIWSQLKNNTQVVRQRTGIQTGQVAFEFMGF